MKSLHRIERKSDSQIKQLFIEHASLAQLQDLLTGRDDDDINANLLSFLAKTPKPQPVTKTAKTTCDLQNIVSEKKASLENALQETIGALENALAAKKTECESTQKSLDTLKTQAKVSQTLVESLELNVKQLENEKTSLKTDFEARIMNLEALLKAESLRLSESQKCFSKSANELAISKQQMSKQHTHYVQRMELLGTQIKGLSEEITAGKSEIGQLCSSAFAEFKRGIVYIENERSKVCSSLEKAKVNGAEQLEALKARAAHLEQLLENERDTKQQLELSQSSLLSDYDADKARLRQLEAQLRDFDALKRELDEQRSTKSGVASTQTATVNSASKATSPDSLIVQRIEEAKLESEKRALEAQFESERLQLQSKIEHLLASQQNAKKEHNTFVDQQETLISELIAKHSLGVAERDEKIAALEAQIATSRDENALLSSKNELLENRLKEWHEKERRQSNRTGELVAEIEDLRIALKRSQRETRLAREQQREELQKLASQPQALVNQSQLVNRLTLECEMLAQELGQSREEHLFALERMQKQLYADKDSAVAETENYYGRLLRDLQAQNAELKDKLWTAVADLSTLAEERVQLLDLSNDLCAQLAFLSNERVPLISLEDKAKSGAFVTVGVSKPTKPVKRSAKPKVRNWNLMKSD